MKSRFATPIKFKANHEGLSFTIMVNLSENVFAKNITTVCGKKSGNINGIALRTLTCVIPF